MWLPWGGVSYTSANCAFSIPRPAGSNSHATEPSNLYDKHNATEQADSHGLHPVLNSAAFRNLLGLTYVIYYGDKATLRT